MVVGVLLAKCFFLYQEMKESEHLSYLSVRLFEDLTIGKEKLLCLV
jgi:hypothetical protein